MDYYKYTAVQEIYDSLKKEAIKYRKDIEDKKSDIRKIDNYLDSLLNKDENDIHVFLARKVENLYRDDIEQNKMKKERLIIECDYLEEYIQALDIKIEKLDKILYDDSSMLHVKHLSDLSSIDIVMNIFQKIQFLYSHMDYNTDSLKHELIAIENNIDKIIEDFNLGIKHDL